MGLTHFNATLPAGVLPEDDAQALLGFMDLLFHPALPTSFYIQMYVVAGTTITFVLAALAIVIRRFVQRTAWLVQFFPTSAGTYIIPNAVMSLCSCIFAYTAVYSAYVFVNIQHYQYDRFPKRFFLWRQLVWWPLWLGAWLCAWGTLSAFPDALRTRGKGGVRRNILRPLFFNVTWMSGPFVCLASLLGPTILASDLYDSQLPRYAAWRAAALSPTPPALPQLVAEARAIWLEVTRVYWYYAWTMAIWTTWACIVVLVFVPIGAHTIWRVRAQVQLARKREQTLHSFHFFPSAELDGRDDAAADMRPVFRRTSDGEVNGFATERKPGQGSPDPGKEVGVATLYPPMKQQRHPLPAGAAASRRKELLQLLYRNIVIQYFGISAGAATFAASAGLLAGETYHSARYNHIGRNQMIANLIAGYAAAVFGSAVITAVLWRSFDSSLTLSPEPEERVAHVERPRPFLALLGAHKAASAKQSEPVGVKSQQSARSATASPPPFISLSAEEEQIATQRSGGLRRGSAATSTGSYRSSSTHTNEHAERKAKSSDAGHESLTPLPSPVRTRRGSASRAMILRGTRSGGSLSGAKGSPRKATTAPSTPTNPSSMQFATPYGVIRAEPAERSPPSVSPPTMSASPGGGSWKSSRQQVLDATQHASIMPRSRYGAWRTAHGTEDGSSTS